MVLGLLGTYFITVGIATHQRSISIASLYNTFRIEIQILYKLCGKIRAGPRSGCTSSPRHVRCQSYEKYDKIRKIYTEISTQYSARTPTKSPIKYGYAIKIVVKTSEK